VVQVFNDAKRVVAGQEADSLLASYPAAEAPAAF